MPRFVRLLTVACACLTLAFAPLASASESTPPTEWDLGLLFPSPEAWDEAYTEAEALIPAVAAWEGRLGEGPAALLAALTARSELSQRLSRLGSYAGNRRNENLGAPENQARHNRFRQLWSRATAAAAWMDPELLALGAARIETMIAEHPAAFADYRFSLQALLDRADHVLTPAEEKLIKSSATHRDQPQRTYRTFTNAEMPWPTIELDGEEKLLNKAAYTRHRDHRDRATRETLFTTFWDAWHPFESTFGETLGGHVEGEAWEAEVRGYEGALAMNLADDQLPTAVYDTLIRSTREHLPTLHRYFRLKARLLGIEQLHYHDIYAPLAPLARDYPLGEAVKRLEEAAAPLGPAYTAHLTAGLAGPYMHVYPAPGKRSGAYMSGWAYGAHPYVLLNYNDNFESASTLAHEWGHAIHSVLSKESQPWPDQRYATFIAEIAAFLNEFLLLDASLANATTPAEELFYLGHELEQVRGAFFRQAMFSEFEQRIYAEHESGQPLTGARMTAIYGDLLRAYHGHAEGVTVIDERYFIEWAYIPHFYRNFYVFQYSTSLAAAAWFAEQLLTGHDEPRERYLALLRAGGSNYPHELLLRAGLDMTQPEAYDALMRRMNSIMDRIEGILDEQAGARS